MKIVQKKIEDVLIIHMQKRFDGSNAQAFSDHVKEKIVKEEERKIVFDLEKLDYMSSAGLRIFTMLQAIMKSYNGVIVISAPNNNIMELFSMVCLQQVYKIFKKEEQALKFLSAGPAVKSDTVSEL